MYFNYTKYIPIVFQLQNTNYFCQVHKIQNTLNVFKIHVFQLLQHWTQYMYAQPVAAFRPAFYLDKM